MRLVAWNVRQGVGAGIIDVLSELRPDVVVLSDVRPRHFGRISSSLGALGLAHTMGSNWEDVTGVLVASNRALTPGAEHSSIEPGRLVHVRVERWADVVGVYGPLPVRARPSKVTAFWHELEASARRLETRPAVVCGDLNTAPAATDSSSGRWLQPTAAAALQRILATGWRDAYREVHADCAGFTFRDYQGAYRIDHILCSPLCTPPSAMSVVSTAAGFEFCRDRRTDRAPQLSDHAALIADW